MMGAVLAKYLPGRTFHLSVCWPTQRQVYSCPEPGERWCRGYTQSLPCSPLRLCGISLLVFSLYFLGSARGEKKNYPHYCVTKHLTISFSTTFLTCVKISWDKTLFPLFIIMLVNLLKDVTINMSCAYVAKRDSCRDLGGCIVLPDDRITEERAGDSDGCRFDGSERFQL